MKLPPWCLWALCASTLFGCANETVMRVEIRPPRDDAGGPAIPSDVSAWELRLERLEGDERCPLSDMVIEGRQLGRLAHAQSFTADAGMGMAIGEVPEGRWALSAVARTESCEPRLFGCRELDLRTEVPEVVVIDVDEVSSDATCGCRACAAGVCEPVDLTCD